TPATSTITRAVLQRRSASTPRPATPRQKIAPSTRAVNGVSAHGQTPIAPAGTTNRNSPVSPASAPKAATSRATGSGTSGCVPSAALSSRRLVHHTQKIRNGVVKYSPAHSQNATRACWNRSQCTIVATPIRLANTPTGTNPPLTGCQRRANATRTKKYAPPRYAEPSTIAVIVGRIGQANSRPAAPGQGYSTAKATTRNGTIASATARVRRSTRSIRTP